MGTKLKPGAFDCYANAAPDEPMFVLLARDPLAPILVRLWSDLREHAAGNPSKVAEARMCALAMKEWRHRKDNPPKLEHVCGLQGYCPGPPHYDPICPACHARFAPLPSSASPHQEEA